MLFLPCYVIVMPVVFCVCFRLLKICDLVCVIFFQLSHCIIFFSDGKPAHIMPQPAVQHGQPKYWVKNLLLYESDRIAVSLLLQQARQWHHPFCCLHASEWGYRPATKGLELTSFASQLVFAPMLPLKDEEQVVQMHHNGVFHWVVSHRRASDSTASIYYRLGTDHFWLQASGTWCIPETRIYPSYLLLEDLTRRIIAFRSVNSLSWHQELHRFLSSKRSRLRSGGPVLRRYTTRSRLPPGTEPTFLPF